MSTPARAMRLAIATAVATTLVAAWLARDARADVSAAARAFADGQAAQLDGNYERAAQSFELAYDIAPSREALRSAVRARQLNNQLPRAATLAAVLAARYADDPVSAKLATDVLAEARTKLARVSVTCAPACTLAVGGRAVSLHAATAHVVFTPAGRLSFEATFGGDRSVTREIALKVGDDMTVPIEAPPLPHAPPTPVAVSPPVASSPSTKPLPPAIAIGGAAATLVLATLTIWSGLDTNKAHDAYLAAPSHDGWNDGRSKQTRTNLLLGSTAVVGLATVLTAALWTRWGSRTATDLALVPERGGVSFALGGRF
jgi:hypothetical protein